MFIIRVGAFLIASIVVLGVLYPLAVGGVASVLFPGQAAGSPVLVDGKVVGSALIGQTTADPGLFWWRPSAGTAAASSGSNLGPAAPNQRKAVNERIAALHAAGPIPAQLVTASGSGLDPDLSPEAARYQIPRISATRHLTPATLEALVTAATIPPQFGILGPPRVNVLALNLALGKLPSVP